ncbi:MAG: ATP-binding protein [Caldilineaceae bacterium]
MITAQLPPVPSDGQEPEGEHQMGFDDMLDAEIEAAGGEMGELEEYVGSIGRTMFDAPNSKDNTVTVLLPDGHIDKAPSQSLVRIKSRSKKRGGDGRQYLGAVVQGPFAEPDGLRADSPIVVTTTVRGPVFIPKYHGRIQVEIIGEEIDGLLIPPRYRPLPNSPVFALDQQETQERLKLLGDVILGLAVGYDNMAVGLPASRKDVFPRHFCILGTTGGGKSTTMSGMIGNLSEKSVAVVIFDTEGEYTRMMQPTQDATMLAALQRRGLEPKGLSKVKILHLVGRETANPEYTDSQQFSLRFSSLSPYAVKEILDFNEAQEDRYLKAHDICRSMLREMKVFPADKSEEAQLLELDELETGVPRMTLQHMYDVVRLCADVAAKKSDAAANGTNKKKSDDADEESSEEEIGYIGSPDLRAHRYSLLNRIKKLGPTHEFSWRKVQGSLSRLLRLKIFDNPAAGHPDYAAMTGPGQVTIIDLSDTDSPQVNNMVISEILRGLQAQQDANYKQSENGVPVRRVVVVIEEAHEFLSAARIKQMPVLFQQVARIARRGRKRWLGLIFVTQLPQHLPDEVLGLVNNYVLHKISDANVISRLKRSIGGVDDGLWDRLPNLAPGQAIVSASSMSRAMLVAIDPTPYQLRMTE